MPAAKPPEFRRRAVELAHRGDQPVAQIAKDLGISGPPNYLTTLTRRRRPRGAASPVRAPASPARRQVVDVAEVQALPAQQRTPLAIGRTLGRVWSGVHWAGTTGPAACRRSTLIRSRAVPSHDFSASSRRTLSVSHNRGGRASRALVVSRRPPGPPPPPPPRPLPPLSVPRSKRVGAHRSRSCSEAGTPLAFARHGLGSDELDSVLETSRVHGKS